MRGRGWREEVEGVREGVERGGRWCEEGGGGGRRCEGGGGGRR